MKKYSLGLYEKAMPSALCWRQKLTAAREAGYDFVEMSIDETKEKLARLDMSKEERIALIQEMFETGIPIRTMCLSGQRKYPLGSHDEKVRKKSLEILGKAIQLADDLGIRIIMLPGYDVYYEEADSQTKAFFLENIKLAADMAAKAGVLMGFETMENEFMNTVKKSMFFIEQVGSPYLAGYPDLGNITNAAVAHESDAELDLETGESHLLAMHLKETVPGVFREIPYGSGHVDFAKGIHAAWRLGIRKYVTEFWYTGSETWEQDLKDVVQRMTQILDAEV